MAEAAGAYAFDLDRFFPEDVFWRITDARVDKPEVVALEQRSRQRRTRLAPDGKLVILAADHPARMSTATPSDPLGMTNRHAYLGRVLRALAGGLIDGLMATPDVLDDVFIVNHLVKQGGGPGFLDGKVLLGSMNRSGLAGTVFEMDDDMSAYSADGIAEANLDGAKVLWRLDPNEPGSGRTLMYIADAVSELSAMGLPSFLEPLPVKRTENGYQPVKDPIELLKQIGVLSGLGGNTARTWLKIPVCEDYERVVRATTMPLLMLGGASHDNPEPTIREFARGLQGGPNVRGAMVGRNVLYPGQDDPLAVGNVISEIIHDGSGPDEALARLPAYRDQNIDLLTRYALA